MLSRSELEFLKAPDSFNPDYSRTLKHRIRGKVQALQEELRLLEIAGFLSVTRSCNAVTDFCNGEQGLNQAAFEDWWCGRRDLNPGRQRGRLMS